MNPQEYGYHSSDATYQGDYLLKAVVPPCRERRATQILDLGCGNGFLTRQLADAGFQMTGCDPSTSGIAAARSAAPGIRFEVAGVDDPPAVIGTNAFDAVVSLEVVEHLSAPRNLPRFAHAVLKPGGYLIVSTPYHGYLKNLVIALLGKWDAHHDPLWDGGHIKFWSSATLRRMIEHEGFAFEAFVGAGRMPWLWKSMVLVFRKA